MKSSSSLIVVTGPAAAGKSTVCRGLQKWLSREGEFWLVMGLDSFARGLSTEWLSIGGHSGRYAELGLAYGPAASGGIELTLGPDGRRLLAAFHRSVAATVASGVNVICEAVIHDDVDRREWLAALGEIVPTWVLLTASVEVLEARERADPSRVFQGLARGMSGRPPTGTYDIEADSGTESPDEIIRRIVESL